MSLASMFGIGTGGEDPLAVRQREEGAARLAAQQNQMQLDYLNQLRQDQLAKEAALAAKDPTSIRQAALGQVGSIFGPEFQSSYIPGNITDPYEQQVYGEQETNVNDYLNRLLKRGVITDTGLTAGKAEIAKQAPRVRTQLDDIANALIESERGKIGDIAGRAKEAASTLEVGGSPFDITPYSGALNTELGTFTSGLSDKFRAGIPSDLFDTSTLASIAGGAQGAGNQPFAPDITPTGTKTDETDPFSGQKPVQKRTTSVF